MDGGTISELVNNRITIGTSNRNQQLFTNVVLSQAELADIQTEARSVSELRDMVGDNQFSIIVSAGSVVSALGSIIAGSASLYLAYRILLRNNNRLRLAEAELARDLARVSKKGKK